MSPDDKPPIADWYADGLRFECKGCGTCCRGEGYVWVDRVAARRLAKHLGLEVEEFGSRYLRRVGRRTSLTEKANHDCIFWVSNDGGGAIGGHCEVYDVRPRQCRTFPFWSENLRSEASWREASTTCGGMDSGRLYGIGEIQELASSRGETRASTTQGLAPGAAANAAPETDQEGCGCCKTDGEPG